MIFIKIILIYKIKTYLKIIYNIKNIYNYINLI
jgi:hypothetical protein